MSFSIIFNQRFGGERFDGQGGVYIQILSKWVMCVSGVVRAMIANYGN